MSADELLAFGAAMRYKTLMFSVAALPTSSCTKYYTTVVAAG